MKRAFITGATGFLGLNLVQQLQKGDWEIIALHLPNENLNDLSQFDVTAVAGDILDRESLMRVIPDSLDAVFHVAGDISMWKKNDERQHRINVLGTENMCKVALKKNVGRFVYTSSSSAFGAHSHRITELTPSNALECGMSYNRSKFLAEQVVKRAADYGLFSVILNPCNIIGPYDPGNWSQIIRRILDHSVPGYPPGIGTFAHARDVADAHIAAVSHGQKGANYLLGGVEASFQEVMLEIVRITGVDTVLKPLSREKLRLVMYLSLGKSFFDGKEPMLTYPKYQRLVGNLSCDDSSARATLNFSTTSITEMLSDSYQWLRTEGMV